MKRFIQHDELARDCRFIRQQNVLTTILASLPDDVDAVVEALDPLSPLIEESVRETAAQPLFDRFGPAFALLVLNEPIRAGADGVAERLKLRMHGIFVGELQALEGAGRSLWDFPEAPWEFKMNMARQCWDEARHVQIYEKLMTHVGVEAGDYPESTFLFECACSDDPAMRVAGVNRGLEGLACDVFRDLIRYAEDTGDEKMKQAVDYVLADEITHVRFGSEWVKEFTRGDPEHFERTQEFRREVDKQFSFGGSRSDREDAAVRIAWEDRLEAGFSEQELKELAEISVGGPSQHTMVTAAKILQQRFDARKAGEADEGRA
ncbi:MAG: DUF455 family protein [Myxococcales bacterium]|nr:DUF455 family protein [Myxococcales bacterium]